MFCVDFLMHQNHMSLLLLIHNVIHPNDPNILLMVDVVLNVALSKFTQQNFHEILEYQLLRQSATACTNSALQHVPCIDILFIYSFHEFSVLLSIKRSGLLLGIEHQLV